MGYFSNGTEGMMYEEEYCFQCIHNNEEEQCQVWYLHEVFNYDAVGKNADKNIKKILNALIPRKENGVNGECSMYLER